MALAKSLKDLWIYGKFQKTYRMNVIKQGRKDKKMFKEISG